MTQILTKTAPLRRPRILIEAARIAGKDYQRQKALGRIFKANRPKAQHALIAALRIHESEIEASRQLADGTYNGRKHVQVMTALMAEMRRG